MMIGSKAQLRALYAPVRQEVLDTLEAAGPCTIRDLSRLLGRAATALYTHVAVLERVGLVVARGERREGRHVATVYDAAARPNRLDYDGPGGRTPIVKIVASAMRLSQREFARACVGHARANGSTRLVWGGRARGWLTASEVRELNGLLDRAQALLRGARPRPRTRAISLGFVLSPVEAKGAGTIARSSTTRRRGARPRGKERS